MALATADLLASFDQSNGEFLDLSPVLATVLLADTWLLGALPFGGQEATQTTHSWVEDSLNAATVTQASGDTALDAGGSDTNMDVATGTASLLRVGALLRDQAADKSEILQVTAISTDTLTITRGYGSTSAEAHAAGAVWLIIGQPQQEGDENINDRSKTRTKQDNYTQIFKSEVKVSGTMQSSNQAGVPDEFKYQIGQRTMEIKRELGAAVYHSGISTNDGSDTVYRTMKGLREWLTDGSNTNSTAESISEGVVNAMYRQAWNDGGDPRLFVGSADQITKFSDIQSNEIRVAPSDRVRGQFVTRFLTDLGAELELLVDRWIQQDEVALLDPSRIRVVPLQGRNFQMKPLLPIGDAERAMLVGEFTLECRNASEAHAIHTNLNV